MQCNSNLKMRIESHYIPQCLAVPLTVTISPCTQDVAAGAEAIKAMHAGLSTPTVAAHV
jgi:hypothetical protein